MHDDVQRRFLAALEHYRYAHNLSQKELAAKLDVSEQNISRWVNRDTFPRMATFARICEIIGFHPPENLGRGALILAEDTKPSYTLRQSYHENATTLIGKLENGMVRKLHPASVALNDLVPRPPGTDESIAIIIYGAKTLVLRKIRQPQLIPLGSPVAIESPAGGIYLRRLAEEGSRFFGDGDDGAVYINSQSSYLVVQVLAPPTDLDF